MGLLHTKIPSFGDRQPQPGGLLIGLNAKGELWIKAAVDAPPTGTLKELFDAGVAPVLGITDGEPWRHPTVRRIATTSPARQQLIDLAGGLEPGESKELLT
jgi:hypothetical protein